MDNVFDNCISHDIPKASSWEGAMFNPCHIFVYMGSYYFFWMLNLNSTSRFPLFTGDQTIDSWPKLHMLTVTKLFICDQTFHAWKPFTRDQTVHPWPSTKPFSCDQTIHSWPPWPNCSPVTKLLIGDQTVRVCQNTTTGTQTIHRWLNRSHVTKPFGCDQTFYTWSN